MFTRGKVGGEGELGSLGLILYTAIFKIENQQGPAM